jgi:hypothetical protein
LVRSIATLGPITGIKNQSDAIVAMIDCARDIVIAIRIVQATATVTTIVVERGECAAPGVVFTGDPLLGAIILIDAIVLLDATAVYAATHAVVGGARGVYALGAIARVGDEVELGAMIDVAIGKRQSGAVRIGLAAPTITATTVAVKCGIAGPSCRQRFAGFAANVAAKATFQIAVSRATIVVVVVAVVTVFTVAAGWTLQLAVPAGSRAAAS